MMTDLMTFFHLEGEGFLDSDFPIITNSEEQLIQEEDIPDELGLLILKNTILFPGVVMPITVQRDKAIQLVKEANKSEDKLLGVVAQKNMAIEDPTEEDLYRVGTIAKILRLIKMPDGSITIVIQGRNKFQISEFTQQDPYFKASISKVIDKEPAQKKGKALMFNLKEQAFKIIDLSSNIPSEAKIVIENIDSLSFLIHFISANLSLEVNQKQEILESKTLTDKAEMVLAHLNNELNILELSEEIQIKVKSDLDQQQREYILRQQIRAIQDELGDNSEESEIDSFRKRAGEKNWSEEVTAVFEKELTRLSRINPSMPDYAIVVNYLEWLLDLPWYSYSEDSFDFKQVKKILDEDHYGLEKVKERILEQLAVLKLKSDKKAAILCFHGPPGVGKTSLGKSIARAMGKEFIRISLGGTHDEAEIRGHRRTYIGALPGRIIQGLKKAKTGNPVFMLDEIDKVGNNFRGDPSSALLEVLDPEQNNTFRDNYLEVEYDLSRVMFIATANTLSTIHPALRDRMEIIEINGYSQEEKKEIARRHLIPKARKDHGLKASQLSITPKAIKQIISQYTLESGVRSLSKQFAALSRVAAKEIVLNDKEVIRVSERNLKSFLGIPKFENEKYQKFSVPGVAIGLAWTAVGGEILFIESTLTPGSGKLSMTGQLGDVMKESATLAYTYLKSNCHRFDIAHDVFKRWDVHIHIPAGAIPKDGPSAGITMLTSLTSLFSQRLVMPSLAMTGEITLRGKVLPVGGIKEKVLAAVRAGIKTIILCKENEKDISEIKEDYLKGLTVHYVEKMTEVIALAVHKERSSDARDLLPDPPSSSTQIKQIA